MYKEMGLTIKNKHVLRKSLTLPTYTDQRTPLYIPPIDKESPSSDSSPPPSPTSPPSSSPSLDRHVVAEDTDEPSEALVASPRNTVPLHHSGNVVAQVPLNSVQASPLSLQDWEEEVRMC